MIKVKDLPPLDCGGCRKCCIGDKIEIHPENGDNHKRWKTDFNGPHLPRTLKRTANGNCVYLGLKGCTIHGKQPYDCKVYDCRELFIMVRAMGSAAIQRRMNSPPFLEGKRRVEQLEGVINAI